ncbi:hypothetical protein [Yoonia maritima]|nr:hypothetical protein [Yoonia maritima]
MTFQTNNTLITNREMIIELAKVAVREIFLLPATVLRAVHRIATKR